MSPDPHLAKTGLPQSPGFFASLLWLRLVLAFLLRSQPPGSSLDRISQSLSRHPRPPSQQPSRFPSPLTSREPTEVRLPLGLWFSPAAATACRQVCLIGCPHYRGSITPALQPQT